MYQQQGVISQNKKNSISQKFPNRSFCVIHQNDCLFILHVAAHLVFMDIFFFNPKFSSREVCYVNSQVTGMAMGDVVRFEPPLPVP